jgi:hypothetical protein
MIHEFNKACNDSPHFDARSILGMTCDEELILHHTCGMLGVPGNISSCTLLHGIHLAIIIGILTKLKVVGDDAAGWLLISRMTKSQLLELLRGIGKISAPKMEFWDNEDHVGVEDSTWNYVKRPIDRSGNRLVQKEQPIWPAIPSLLQERDSFHTSQSPTNEHDGYKKYSSRMLSFVLQFERFELEEVETEFIDRFVRTMNRAVEIDSYEERTGKRFVRPHTFNGSEVKSLLVSTYWRRTVVIPESIKCHRQVIPEKDMPYVGVMSRALVIAKELGYADMTPRFRTILPCYQEKEFDEFLSRQIRQSYDIKVHCRCPPWLFSLIQTSNTLSDAVDSESDDYDLEKM